MKSERPDPARTITDTISRRSIYREPTDSYLQIQNQALMQFFGGRTGGEAIQASMQRLGLSLEQQKKRQRLYEQRNSNQLNQKASLQSLSSQQRILGQIQGH